MSYNNNNNEKEIFYHLLHDDNDNNDVVVSRLIRSQALYDWISKRIKILSQGRKKKKNTISNTIPIILYITTCHGSNRKR